MAWVKIDLWAYTGSEGNIMLRINIKTILLILGVLFPATFMLLGD